MSWLKRSIMLLSWRRSSSDACSAVRRPSLSDRLLGWFWCSAVCWLKRSILLLSWRWPTSDACGAACRQMLSGRLLS